MVFLYLERSKFKFRKNGFCSPSDPPLTPPPRFFSRLLGAGRALTFRKFPEKMDIGSKKMYLQEVCEGGQKNQGHVTFPRKSRAVVGDIRKNGQNFGDLNFHKI